MEEKKKNRIWPFVVLAVITVLALILAAVLLLGGTDADWQEQYDLGRRYLEEGNYEEAILAFSAAIEIDPKRPEAYLARGDAYMELGDYESAMEDYERAQRRDPDNEEIGEKIEELEERIEEQEKQETEQEQAAKSMKKLIRMKYEEEDYRTEEWYFSYNEAGLMTKAIWERTNYEGETSQHTTLFSYNENGQLTEINESDNYGQPIKILYVYDNNGQLIQKTYQDNWRGSVFEYDEQYEYDEQGRVIRKTSEYSGEETIYTYNSAGQLISESTECYFDGTYIDSSETDYYYDSDGILVRTERLYTSANVGVTEEYVTIREYIYDYKLLTLEEIIHEENLGYREMWVAANDYPIDNGYRFSIYISESDTFEEEDGYLMKMTGDGYSYEFFYEDISEQPEEEPQQTVSRSSAEYEVQRVDDSYYDGNGVMRLEKYYDQIVLLGDEREYAAINAAIQAQRDAFFANWTDEDMESILPSMYDEQFFIDTAVATVTHNADGIFSFYMTTAWYMGGVFNADHYGQTYDLTTGETLDLPACFGMSETELVAAMKDNAWAYLSANCYDAMFDDARETLYAYQLADFNYYIEDGQLILTFPTYILSYGAAGPLTAPTGIYIP